MLIIIGPNIQWPLSYTDLQHLYAQLVMDFSPQAPHYVVYIILMQTVVLGV